MYYCLPAGCLYDWQKTSGPEKKVTPRRLSESAVMDTFPQGIIDSFSHNDVNLTKWKKKKNHILTRSAKLITILLSRQLSDLF